MKHLIKYKLFENSNEYDNKFVGSSDVSNWSSDDVEFIELSKKQAFSEYEVNKIKEHYFSEYQERKDVHFEVILVSEDRIKIDIYIRRKNRKRPVLNSFTTITKLSDEYFWVELKNVLTLNSYVFKCDGLEGLIDTLKKL